MDNIAKFVASNGWLQKFKRRHNIAHVAMVGEKGSSDYAAAEKYVSDLRKHLIECNYLPQEVMEILINIDECGLQWKSLPKKTYAVRGKPVKAKKLVKDRVTILVGAAMDGHKFKPLVIGKSLNPRCLKNVDRSTLPVHYYANKSAWMDRDIMKDWFYNHFLQEVRLRYGTRQIILTLDNAGSHPPDLGVSEPQVDAGYLPANTTPLIQPMDILLHCMVTRKSKVDI